MRLAAILQARNVLSTLKPNTAMAPLRAAVAGADEATAMAAGRRGGGFGDMAASDLGGPAADGQPAAGAAAADGQPGFWNGMQKVGLSVGSLPAPAPRATVIGGRNRHGCSGGRSDGTTHCSYFASGRLVAGVVMAGSRMHAAHQKRLNALRKLPMT